MSASARLYEVMHRLRRECPWDAEQTHRSLATYLVEETGEVLDAIESGDDTDLVEELGDLLLQVYFHAAIAEQEGRFTLDDVADGIADKLVRRHPYVFGDDDVPHDLHGTWEVRKRAEKQRSSAMEGIAEHLSVLARATKVASRARHHGVELEAPAGVPSPEPLTATQVGSEILGLVLRAQASGVDADQAARDALRELEQRVRDTERSRG